MYAVRSQDGGYLWKGDLLKGEDARAFWALITFCFLVRVLKVPCLCKSTKLHATETFSSMKLQ